MIRLLSSILHHYEGEPQEDSAPVTNRLDMEEVENLGHVSSDSGMYIVHHVWSLFEYVIVLVGVKFSRLTVLVVKLGGQWHLSTLLSTKAAC